MWHNIKNTFYKTMKIVIIAALILVAWSFARHHVPKKYAEHSIALKVNDVITFVEKIAQPLINSEAVSSILIKMNPPDYANLIRTIKANQIASVIQSRATEKREKLLVFIYDISCPSVLTGLECDILFNNVNDYTATLTDESTIVMSVAIANSKNEFITYLNNTKRGIFFKPLMLDPADTNKLGAYLKKVDPNFRTLPYLAHVSSSSGIRNYSSNNITSSQLQKWLNQ